MPSLYRAPPSRLKLFSLPSAGTTVTTDSVIACAILVTQVADREVATESSGRVSGDRSAPLEGSGLISRENGLPVEAAATLRSEQAPPSEAPSTARIDPGVPVELLGTAAVAVTGDTPLPIEADAAVRSDRGFPVEDGAVLRTDRSLMAEALATSRTDAGAELAAETLAGLAPDTSGSIEWLGTGATITTDAVLRLEWQETPRPALVSLESGPGRIRLLATRGRARLVRRN